MRRRPSSAKLGAKHSAPPRHGARPLAPQHTERSPRPQPKAPARPVSLVAEVVNIGATQRGRPLHKELHQTEWRLVLPEGLAVTAGDFVHGTPHPEDRLVLQVTSKLSKAKAAVAAATANFNLPAHFTLAEETAAAAPPAYTWDKTEQREDWRPLPFITIDGEDAKDFDDAVQAEPLDNGGWLVRVAIADVAHYVAQGSVLDACATARGNSTYFPGSVIPMLPERLSNNLCSLNPTTDKPVLGVEMWLSNTGHLQHYRFCRAAIHSVRRCTYNEVQGFLDNTFNLPEALHAPIHALHSAYIVLLAARLARGAISLEVPELKLDLDPQGEVTGATPRPRLAAHMLIEELMILANVAAATALANGCADTRPGHAKKHKGVPGVYRVHAPPSREKLETLRNVLAPLGFTAPPPQSRPAAWAALATRMVSHPAAPTLQKALLQAQMQAQYHTDNIGHFGLALPLYTHFTSPIRRYADLLVHRALLQLLGLGLTELPSATKTEGLCLSTNLTERRSQQAEWEARDRMLAGFMAEKIGQTFTGVVTGVAPFGCFVALDGGLAEALLPKWHLQDYAYIGGQSCFRKVQHGKGVLRVGQQVAVQLLQADFAAGRLTVGLPNPTEAAPIPLKPTAETLTPARPLTRRPKRR